MNPGADDPTPILSDRAVQQNFQQQLETNRRIRRLLHLLFDALTRTGTGFTLPADLVQDFQRGLDSTG